MASDRTGIHKHGAGWRAVVSQGRGAPRLTLHFPIETSLHDMQEWRADAKALARVTRKQRANSGTFEADAKRYLHAVRALPTFRERHRHIELWVSVFGVRRRDSIRPAEIRGQRDAWLMAPRSDDDLRHSLATIAFELTGSLDVVMSLLQHASRTTTARYVMAAQLRVLQKQTEPLARHFSADPTPSGASRNRA